MLPTAVEQDTTKRSHMSWAKRAIPLKSTTLFKKADHSQEWYAEVGATAGELHPSHHRFPWGFIRNHTDTYLKKKGKISQEEADRRLSMLVQTHPARDVAIASVAHAMSAQSLDQLLLAETNVMCGSYWGLESWLQSVIAAHEGNPALTTRLQAEWARALLPYATTGASAAGYYLKGVKRALKDHKTQNMDVDLHNFAVLLRRAIQDYAEQLNGLRLTCNWVAAKKAVDWMTELDLSSSSDSPCINIESIFDRHHFSAWRMWASWKPDVNRITRLSKIDIIHMSTILDLVALEGPDMITGTKHTLRQGLIAGYGEQRNWVHYRGLIIEVPEHTKACLATILERLVEGLDTVFTSLPHGESLFNLFRALTIGGTITKSSLDLFDASLEITCTPEKDYHAFIRELWCEKDQIGGLHIHALQQVLHLLDAPQATTFREVFLQDWLFKGIEECFRECQSVIRAQMKTSAWLRLLLELHTFCTAVKASEHVFPRLKPSIRADMSAWPSAKRMTSIKEIYVAAQNVHLNKLQTRNSFVWVDPDTSTKSLLLEKDQKSRHALEVIIEKHCVDHLLSAEVSCDSTEQILRDTLEVWENTGEGVDDDDMRMLAILISRDINNPAEHKCECIYEVAVDLSLGRASSFVGDMVRIVRVQETDSRQAIIALTNILAIREGCTRCWRGVLLRWLNQNEKQEARRGTAIVDHLIQTMDTTIWISFMQSLEALFADVIADNTKKHDLPSLLQPGLLSWVSEVAKFDRTLTKLEEVSDSPFAVRRILSYGYESRRKENVAILSYLQKAEGNSAETVMQNVVMLTSGRKSDMREVIDCLAKLLDAPYEAIEACNEIWDAKCGFLDIPGLPTHEQAGLSRLIERDHVYYDCTSKQYETTPQPDCSKSKTRKSHHIIAKRRYDIPSAVAEVMVAGWIQNDDVAPETKTVIEHLARLLDLEVYKSAIPKSKLSEAIEFWDGIEAEIMREAERLEGLKRTLKAKDPLQTALLIKEYSIPDSNLLEDEIQELPSGIIDLVELIDDDEIEMSFTLASYTELQRSAMGVPSTANNLLVRLTIDRYGSKSPAFCVHYDSDKNIETDQHFPWICVATSNAPHGNVCFSKQTAFVWQMNRHIHRYLRTGNVSIRGLYGIVQTMIGEMGQRCISCGSRHKRKNTQLRRSTPCWAVACQLLWQVITEQKAYALPLDVRIPEIRTDIFAVDMLLSSIYSAAMANKVELLPNCPIHPISTVKTILDSLPKLSIIRDAVHISSVLSKYHVDAEKLISWAFCPGKCESGARNGVYVKTAESFFTDYSVVSWDVAGSSSCYTC
ncbi:hypothetical protein J4E91_011060 [Alternaria rosae]|nr:hypothetical protein J4E91_011060 [Alternaria rosae]